MKLLQDLRDGTVLALSMAITALIIVPFTIYKLVMWPFEKPLQLSNAEAASFLRRCIDGSVEEDELDYFSSVDIADAQLQIIMKDVGKLFGPDWPTSGPLPPLTRKALEELLKRVEALPETVTN